MRNIERRLQALEDRVRPEGRRITRRFCESMAEIQHQLRCVGCDEEPPRQPVDYSSVGQYWENKELSPEIRAKIDELTGRNVHA